MNDGTFRKLDGEDEKGFGPEALLICGYSKEEGAAIKGLLSDVGATDHQIILCTETMLDKTVGQALTGDDNSEPAPADKLPKVVLLSGLSDAQVRGFLNGFNKLGFVRPIFATATPSNLEFPVKGLLIELIREHREMAKMRQQGK